MLRTILASTVLAATTAGFAFAASDEVDPAAEPIPQPDPVTEGKADDPESPMAEAPADVSGTGGRAPSIVVDEIVPGKEYNIKLLAPDEVDEQSDVPNVQ